MILLFGGTSETAGIATSLAQQGLRVLVSTATDNELDTGNHENISLRRGKMDLSDMVSLVKENSIKAIVDATHPFAEVVSANAKSASLSTQTPYFRFMREGADYNYEKIVFADSHEAAAESAFGFGKPVLLTSGSRNLLPYVALARKQGITIIARVLNHPESLQACKASGLAEGEIITGRGPFSVEENLRVIREFGIGVVVSKDSGKAGGVPDKVEAARIENCVVILIKRPDVGVGNEFSDVSLLVKAVKRDTGGNNG